MNDLEMLLRRVLELDFTAVPLIIDELQERANNGHKPHQLSQFKRIVGVAVEAVVNCVVNEDTIHQYERKIKAERARFKMRIREAFWEELIPIDMVVSILGAMKPKEEKAPPEEKFTEEEIEEAASRYQRTSNSGTFREIRWNSSSNKFEINE